MKSYRLKQVQVLPISLEEAWDFFSSPHNLEKITPKDMRFDVISEVPDGKVYSGQIIKYIVSPVLNIPIHWVTEITHVEDQKYFVDNQRVGPYAMWHHQHIFKSVPGGVEMTDIVDYALPMGILGQFAHWLFVKRQVEQIFSFRRSTLTNFFGNRQQLNPAMAS